jgi:hypothetical protein
MPRGAKDQGTRLTGVVTTVTRRVGRIGALDAEDLNITNADVIAAVSGGVYWGASFSAHNQYFARTGINTAVAGGVGG